MGRAPLVQTCCHTGPAYRIARDRLIDCCGGAGRMPVDESHVDLFDISGLKLPGERLVSSIVSCNDERTTGAFIQAMNDSRPKVATCRRQLSKAIEKCVNQRP